MTRCVLVFICMLLLSNTIHAQTTELPVAQLSRPDTVRAVQHLFQRHRTGGWIWAAVGGLLTGRVVSAAIRDKADGYHTSASGTVLAVAVFGGVPAGIGIGKLTRFSSAKEEQVIMLYEKSGILPPYVRKRLKPQAFRK